MLHSFPLPNNYMSSSDIIYIRELKILASVGYFEWEQRIKQPILLDIEMKTDIRCAAKSLKLTDTIDYSVLAQRLKDFIAEKSFLLLETLAEECAALILSEFKTTHVRLRVSKFAILPNARDSGIIIERTSDAH